MALPIFPFSPLPAGTDRMPDWNAEVQVYDSGDQQGLTPWLRPLYDYRLPLKNYTEIKHSSLWYFISVVAKQQTNPFLMRDPYDFAINSVLAVRSGISAGSLFLFDVNSFMVRADTTTVGSFFSSLSGYVKLGTNYNYDQDSGVINLTIKSNTDVWGARSVFYFKKVRLMEPFRETSPLWNIFQGDLHLKEMP